MTGAYARAGWGDPQSEPPLPARDVPGFFHYDLQWVRAEEGRMIGLSKSNYINREEEYSVTTRITKLKVMQKSGIGAVALSDYLNRDGAEHNPELGHHVLMTCGLPVRSGAELARLLDARERKRDRTYRQYGGRLPRVAVHAIISFRWGMTDQAAIDALNRHAHLISDML